MDRYSEIDFLRKSLAVQVDTSNTSIDKNDLDYSMGVSVPEFCNSRIIRFFEESDVMYDQIFDPQTLEEEQTQEINSAQAADSVLNLFKD